VARLTGLSFAHPAVLSGERAALSHDGGSLRALHRRLRALGHEAFLLSTCLRVEIVWEGRPDGATDLLTSIYRDDSMSDLGVIRSDEEVFLHLCRIAAGLESPVLGEIEVLSQFRQAVSAFVENATGAGDLARALDAAVGIGRGIRRHLGHTGGSMASVAAEAAKDHERVAILGAGAMARATAARLPSEAVQVFTRRPGLVAGHHALPWVEALEALATSSAVISTVPGRAPLFPDEKVAAALARRTRPLLLIDLGLPPGFDRFRGVAEILHMGIDDIASTVRQEPRLELEELVENQAASTWFRLTASNRAATLIAAMVDEAERAVDEEVQRFAGRLSTAADPEAVLHQLAHTVARRVLHRPIRYVGSSEQGSDGVQILAEAFGVDDE
jgi:glutamyl-tRNA reductase